MAQRLLILLTAALMMLMTSPARAANVLISWTAPTTNADGSPLIDLSHYRLYRCVGSGCTPIFLRIIGQSTSATDTGLAELTIYRYILTAVDASGNESAPSNLAEAITGDDPDPPSPLVAAYGFNEGTGNTLHDATGQHDGTISGATWTAGRFGGALNFDGTNDRVTIPDHAALDLTRMTLMAWVYPTINLTNWRTVIQKEPLTYYLHANSPNNRPAFGVTIGGEQILYGGNRLPRNQWTHLAATYDGIRQRLYVNGVQVAQRNQSGTVEMSTGVLRIGGNSYGEWMRGRIDEVRMYNVALPAAEIATLRLTPIE